MPIQSDLAAWLLPCRKTAGPVRPIEKIQTILPATLRTKVTDADGSVVDPGIEWEHHGLRHGYVSYHAYKVS